MNLFLIKETTIRKLKMEKQKLQTKYILLPNRWTFVILYICSVGFLNAKENNCLSPRHINTLLREDLKVLKANSKSNQLKMLSAEIFISLFHEGINEAIPFLKDYKDDAYKVLLEKTITTLKTKDNIHEIFPAKTYTDSKQANGKWSYSSFDIFNNFSGKWYGSWKQKEVNHNWLPPKLLVPEKFNVLTKTALKAYQSAFVGDGFGWNYLISIDNQLHIIGYVCHFDQIGDISMKRFHLGIPQPNEAIIWITKDHSYFEYVCSNIIHRSLGKNKIILKLSKLFRRYIPISFS